MQNTQVKFEKHKEEIFKKISSLEQHIIEIKQKDDTEDFCKGIAPFIVSITSFFKASINSFKESHDAYLYINDVSDKTRIIHNIISEYINLDKTQRIPSVFNSDCPRTSLINSLQLMVASNQQLYQTLIANQQDVEKRGNQISSPSKSTFIPTPTFQEEYKQWNIFLPIQKVLYFIFYKVIYSIFYGSWNTAIRFLRSGIFKLFVLIAVATAISHYWDDISAKTAEVLKSDTPDIEEPPYALIDKIHMEIKDGQNNPSLNEQINAIYEAKKVENANYKIEFLNNIFSITGTYTRNQCRNLLDRYEIFYPEGSLSINKVKITERVNFSNYKSSSHSHPANFYCNDMNEMELKFAFSDIQNFYSSGEYRNDWANKIIAADAYYHTSENANTFNHFLHYYKPLALERLEKLKGYPEYQKILSNVKNPKKPLGESIK